MTEEEAQTWIADRFGDSAIESLRRFVQLVRAESARQNLVSAASLDAIWTRHIVDSAQLLDLASDRPGRWIDIGTGAGFPGLVVGLLSDRNTLLVEPRRRRADFLRSVVEELALGHVAVRQGRVETISDHASIISARAVASIEVLLASAGQCATQHTRWLLPKGQNALEEVAQASASWHGTFHVEHSITDRNSMIVVASGVSRR